MTDREASIRSTVHSAIDANLDGARKGVDDCALPRPIDTRRMLAVQIVMGEIADEWAIGHTDVSEHWLKLASIAQDAIEETLVDAARRPITPEDFTR